MSTNTVRVSSTATKILAINALFIALTLVATMLINIRLPFIGSGGLVHLGNVPLFIAALVYGKKTGAIAGAFGMGMFDLISGWTAWTPFTFVIVGTMGWAMGLMADTLRWKPVIVHTMAVGIALILKVTGYYVAEVILYGNWVAPLGSIPGNVMQVVIAGIIVLPVAGRLKKIAE